MAITYWEKMIEKITDLPSETIDITGRGNNNFNMLKYVMESEKNHRIPEELSRSDRILEVQSRTGNVSWKGIMSQTVPNIAGSQGQWQTIELRNLE